MADRHDVQLRTKLLEKIFPSVDTVDNLESDNPNRPLSARQGKVLKELINAGGGGGSGLSIEVVESLPATGVKGILYLVPKTSYLKEENTYDEYVWIESSRKYELLGSFSTDLNIEEYVDKFNSILGEVGEINVATLSDYGINSYVTTGTYRVYGERINSKDGLPIINAANGHTVEGILKVYNSSIAGTGKNTDKVVTQMLSMSNRHGGDGHIWIRTGQGASEDNLTWSTWEKLQGVFEKNTIENVSELDTFTTNGIYSCMYVGGSGGLDNIPLYSGDILLIIVVNGYMASSIGVTPHLTQTIFKTSNSETNQIITRAAVWNGNNWIFDFHNGIVLGSFYGMNANIGGVGFRESTINIGTWGQGPIDISGNVFIGQKGSYYDNRRDNATIISDNVRIGERVVIGTESNNEDTIIGVSSKLFIDGQYFNIQNDGNNTRLAIANNTHLSVKGGETSSIEYKRANTMVINSPSVTLGDGGGPISIGRDVTIGSSVSIGGTANIGGSVSIGHFDSSKSVSIGPQVHMKNNINIGDNVKIGDSVEILDSVILGTFDNSKSVSINGNVHIKGPVNIQGSFTSGDSVNIGNILTIGNNVNIANDVNIDNGVKLVNETNGLKIGTSTGNSLTISTNECSMRITSPNTDGKLIFSGNSMITCNAERIQLGDGTGGINIAGNIVIEKDFRFVNNSLTIGTIIFNENNILFQVGAKTATLQLS